MFKKYLEKRKQENEVMEKILVLLDDINKWTIDRITYTHTDVDFAIYWGTEWLGFGGGVTLYRSIIKPVRMEIPNRYRKKIKQKLDCIIDRDFKDDDLSFLSNFLDGEYCASFPIGRDNRSEITIWLNEQNIDGWYIANDLMWFNKEEDAMAVKLRWT